MACRFSKGGFEKYLMTLVSLDLYFIQELNVKGEQ